MSHHIWTRLPLYVGVSVATYITVALIIMGA